ncbi:hypothetical protein Esti_003123 [Eimeria stiedai]
MASGSTFKPLKDLAGIGGLLGLVEPALRLRPTFQLPQRASFSPGACASSNNFIYSSNVSCSSLRSASDSNEQQGRLASLAFVAAGLSASVVGWHSNSRSNRGSLSNSDSSRICSCASSTPYPCAEVYVWGSNLDGQLGIDSGLSVSLPAVLTALPLRPKETVSAISGGSRHSACITSEGRVFVWGRGGAAGGSSGGSSAAEGPREVVLPLQDGDTPVAVSCGSNHSLVVTKLGRLYSWGSNSHGQCGRPCFEASQPANEAEASRPSPVEGLGYSDVFGGRLGASSSLPPGQVGGPLAGCKVMGASCGDRVSAAVTADGEIFVWGEARSGGSLGGVSGEGPSNHEPRRVTLPSRGHAGGPSAADQEEDSKAVAVACGEGHCLALTSDGRVYAWGSNSYGQLGVGGSPRVVQAPELVTALKEHRVTAISCGALHSLCLTEKGTVFVWGYGKDGQCAQPSRLDVPLPLQVEAAGEGPLGGPQMGPCTHVSGGEGHSLAVCGKGRLFMWGRGREGQLGRGALVESSAASRDSPVEVSLGRGKLIRMAACGGCHTIACAEPTAHT